MSPKSDNRNTVVPDEPLAGVTFAASAQSVAEYRSTWLKHQDDARSKLLNRTRGLNRTDPNALEQAELNAADGALTKAVDWNRAALAALDLPDVRPPPRGAAESLGPRGDRGYYDRDAHVVVLDWSWLTWPEPSFGARHEIGHSCEAVDVSRAPGTEFLYSSRAGLSFNALSSKYRYGRLLNEYAADTLAFLGGPPPPTGTESIWIRAEYSLKLPDNALSVRFLELASQLMSQTLSDYAGPVGVLSAGTNEIGVWAISPGSKTSAGLEQGGLYRLVQGSMGGLAFEMFGGTPFFDAVEHLHTLVTKAHCGPRSWIRELNRAFRRAFGSDGMKFLYQLPAPYPDEGAPKGAVSAASVCIFLFSAAQALPHGPRQAFRQQVIGLLHDHKLLLETLKGEELPDREMISAMRHFGGWSPELQKRGQNLIIGLMKAGETDRAIDLLEVLKLKPFAIGWVDSMATMAAAKSGAEWRRLAATLRSSITPCTKLKQAILGWTAGGTVLRWKEFSNSISDTWSKLRALWRKSEEKN